jgi:hypothetical protein
MGLSLNQAAAAASRSKATISKDLSKGKLTGKKVDNRWDIEESELFRCYPPKTKDPVVATDPEPQDERIENRVLQAKLDAAEKRIEDLLQDKQEWKEQAQKLALEGPRSNGWFDRLLGR